MDTDVIASRAWVTEQFHPTGSTGRFTRDSDGLVPHPDSDNQPNYYLGGDGQWHRLLSTSIFTEQNPGLVPAPGFSDQNYFLSASGTWEHAVDLIDSDNIIPALEALNSRWDSDDHSIEVYANIHHPAVPAVPATGGREASFVVTITGSGNTSDGDFLQLRVPAKGATVDNQDTDIFNLVMHNPNISGFAYPPQNANGIRDVLAAYLDQTRYPNRNNVPYIDFVAVSTDGLQHNQLEITVRETRQALSTQITLSYPTHSMDTVSKSSSQILTEKACGQRLDILRFLRMTVSTSSSIRLSLSSVLLNKVIVHSILV